jgi:hypothetical protein
MHSGLQRSNGGGGEHGDVKHMLMPTVAKWNVGFLAWRTMFHVSQMILIKSC